MAMVQGALQWLERPPEGPWVLFLPAIHPHPPFEVEEPWFSMHNRSEMPTPAKTKEKVSCLKSKVGVSVTLTLLSDWLCASLFRANTLPARS